MSDNVLLKSRDYLITLAKVSRTCLNCDACAAPNPQHECRRCCTVHYCSSNCLRALSKHECHDLATMRNALIGIQGAPTDVNDLSQAVNKDTCGICLCDPMVEPAVLPACKHAFCRPCLKDWHALEKFNSQVQCPTCRGVLLFDESDDNPIEKAKIYGAQAMKAKAANAAPEKIKDCCQRGLEELEGLLSKDGYHNYRLLALFVKAEILLLEESQEGAQTALDVLDTLLEMDQENREKRAKLAKILDRAEAERASDKAEEERLMKLAEEIAGPQGDQLGNILQNLVDVFLMQAQAHEQLGDWEAAKQIYNDILGLSQESRLPPTWMIGVFLSANVLVAAYLFGDTENDRYVDANTTIIVRQVAMTTLAVSILYGIFGSFLSAGSSSSSSKSKVLSFPLELHTAAIRQQRQCYMKLIRCHYELKEYSKAIDTGSVAVHMNRRYAGVHEYIAKSYQAQGKLEEAKRTMQRAVIYETPWDVKNIEKQMKLLQGLQ